MCKKIRRLRSVSLLSMPTIFVSNFLNWGRVRLLNHVLNSRFRIWLIQIIKSGGLFSPRCKIEEVTARVSGKYMCQKTRFYQSNKCSKINRYKVVKKMDPVENPTFIEKNKHLKRKIALKMAIYWLCQKKVSPLIKVNRREPIRWQIYCKIWKLKMLISIRSTLGMIVTPKKMNKLGIA